MYVCAGGPTGFNEVLHNTMRTTKDTFRNLEDLSVTSGIWY